jgi:hypothetical protein
MANERGSALVIAMFAIAMMLMIGLATYSQVDTQTGESRVERVRESSFNLAEGTLAAQTYVLGRVGTGTASNPFPPQCDKTSTSSLCPNASNLGKAFDQATQKDFDPTQTGWTTEVHDNTAPAGGTSNYYDDNADWSTVPRYDANGDKQLWVKATATVRDRKRAIVALIKVEERHIDFPRYAIAGGWFETTNNGKKVIADSTGSLGVAVRCNKAPPSADCLGYDPSKGQLAPPGNYQLNYSSATAISPDDLQALEDFAKAKGTYYAGCPADPNGSVVVVESGNCKYTNSAPAAPGASRCCNTPTKPGVLIIKNGTLELSGNIEFYGLVYMPNLGNSSGTVVETQGNAGIIGGVVVDGPGGISAGSNGAVGANNANVLFDPRIFDTVSAAGTAGVVQNTWREIVPD